MPASAILLGDFNMTPRSPEYESLVGALDPVYGRLVEADRFADVLTLAGMAENEGITFPASRGKQPKRIDHGFVNAGSGQPPQAGLDRRQGCGRLRSSARVGGAGYLDCAENNEEDGQ